jgi:hypothetical protein
MTPVSSHAHGNLWGPRLIMRAVWICAVLTAMHPVFGDGFWWELSKGRASVGGRLNPTADLVASEVGRDGPWLSGAIPYLLFSGLGLSGLMLLKIGSVLILTGLLLQRASQPVPQTQSESTTPLASAVDAETAPALLALLIALSALSSREAWDPSPLLFDVLGLVAVYLATEALPSVRLVPRLLVVATLLALWANFGERSLVGVWLVLLAGLYRFQRAAPGPSLAALGFTVFACGACCLTPAGIHSPLNALGVLIPQTVESSELLRLAGWHPWWERGGTAEALAFLGLSVVYLLYVRKQPTVRTLLVFLAAQALAAASAENLPLAAVWMALCATSSRNSPDDRRAEPTRSRTDEVKPSVAGNQPTHPLWETLTCAAALIALAWIASEPWRGCVTGLGWGLDPRLSPEAFAASLIDVPLKGRAHCVGLREAGLLCWFASPGTKPLDTPTTALLGRRLKQHTLLTQDLSNGWKVSHPRADGTPGGWWTTIQDQQVTALVVPSEQVELIAALEPTFWKPLSLSAVSLVYGKAGDPACSPRIVQTLSLRGIVDRGAWTYQAASEASADSFDFRPWSATNTARRQGLRLARLFRAMGMSIGALKVLHSTPGGRWDERRQEWFGNQLELGYRERIACGRASEFRLRAALLSRNPASTGPAPQTILNWPSIDKREPKLADTTALSRACEAYVRGELPAAIALLSDDEPETLYAKSSLLVETGQPQAAQIPLQKLIATFPDHALALPAQTLSESLSAPPGP